MGDSVSDQVKKLEVELEHWRRQFSTEVEKLLGVGIDCWVLPFVPEINTPSYENSHFLPLCSSNGLVGLAFSNHHLVLSKENFQKYGEKIKKSGYTVELDELRLKECAEGLSRRFPGEYWCNS